MVSNQINFIKRNSKGKRLEKFKEKKSTEIRFHRRRRESKSQTIGHNSYVIPSRHTIYEAPIVCSMGLAEFRYNRIMQSPHENYFNICRQHKEK